MKELLEHEESFFQSACAGNSSMHRTPGRRIIRFIFVQDLDDIWKLFLLNISTYTLFLVYKRCTLALLAIEQIRKRYFLIKNWAL